MPGIVVVVFCIYIYSISFNPHSETYYYSYLEIEKLRLKAVM